MAKVWFYGDSFTAGAGLNFKEYMDKTSSNFIENLDIYNDLHWSKIEYLNQFTNWKNTYEDHIYPNYFSKSFNLDFVNRGERGASNDRIIHKIFPDLKDFTSDDIIVIGMTDYARVLVPSKAKNKLMQHAGAAGNYTFIQGGINRWSSNAKESIINFCHDILHKNEKTVSLYYIKLFEDIRKSLLSKVKAVMVWGNYHWDHHQLIREWTEGEVDDGHWSPNGHKAFAEYLLENYHQNNHTLIYKKLLI